MTIEVRVPQLPESVADATLVSWHKKPGDSVVRDENLVDLETDKVVLEVPAPVAGVLKEIKLTDGTTVTSGQLLAVIEEGAAAVPGASAPAIMAAPSGATAAAKDTVAKETAKPESGGKLSPAAKRVAEENKVDPKTVAGSGRDGRVSKSDVVNYLSAKERRCAKPAGGRAESAPPRLRRNSFLRPVPAAIAAEQHVPMTRSARAHRRAHGSGAGNSGAVDLVQRSRLEGRQ